MYYAVAPSQVCAEPKRLAGLGYLTVREEPGRTKPRKVYSLTADGRRALREWMSQRREAVAQVADDELCAADHLI